MLATKSFSRATGDSSAMSTTIPPRPPGTNALGAIERAHASASSLAARVIELADFLCGEQPRNPSQCRQSPDGIFPTLEDAAGVTESHLEEAHDAITRIRNHLPS